jgi:protein phosphatase 1L
MAVVDGKALPLTKDHKPEVPAEKERIEASGAKITDGRIQGQLAMSRAFGNPALKAQEFLSAEPEVTHFTLDDNVQYVVLATDGLWDVMSCRRVASLISIHQRYHKAPGLADELVLEAMRRGSLDNIAVIVLKVNRKSKCAAGQS